MAYPLKPKLKIKVLLALEKIKLIKFLFYSTLYNSTLCIFCRKIAYIKSIYITY